jgi:predicted metalloprotease
MRWTQGYRSEQVEDRRNQSMGGGGRMPGIGILFWLFSRFGLPGVLIGGALLYFLSGGLQSGDSTEQDSAYGSSQDGSRAAGGQDVEAPMVQFVSFVFDDVQKNWTTRFQQTQTPYRLAHLVLFRGQTRSGCGVGAASMGPFYCPNDERVYIDLSFYQQLKQRFGAPGDFAQAYVIGHEMGHHVQHLLGLDERVRHARSSQQVGSEGASVRLELQADCLAGVWARSSQQRDLLEPGDMDEALTAAAAIGDDRLQRQDSEHVSPETWTHGSSEQRARWLRRGFEQGTIESCDTFSAQRL